MIYDLLLKSDGWIGLVNDVGFTTKRLLPGHGLIATCWQVHQETRRIIFQHEILIASVCRNFEMVDLQLTMPKSIIRNVRFLTLHLSAPEVKDERRMQKLRASLLKARSLEKLSIEIFAHRATPVARKTLIGWTGRHALQKGLGLLKDVKINGKVTINLAGHHDFSPSPKTAEKFEKACWEVVKEVERAMMR